MQLAVLMIALALAGCDKFIALDYYEPADAPPSGHDEDGDGFPDGTDNCPGIKNAAQPDGDGDLVGDACDPNPNTNGDRIGVFYAFDTALQPDWVRKSGSWNFVDDKLVYRAGVGFEGIRASNGKTFSARYMVEARVRFDNAPEGSEFSVVAAFDGPTNDGFFCTLKRTATQDEIYAYPSGGVSGVTRIAPLDLAAALTMRLTVDASSIICDIQSDVPGQGAAATGTVGLPRVGPIGFEARDSDTSTDYVVVYTR